VRAPWANIKFESFLNFWLMLELSISRQWRGGIFYPFTVCSFYLGGAFGEWTHFTRRVSRCMFSLFWFADPVTSLMVGSVRRLKNFSPVLIPLARSRRRFRFAQDLIFIRGSMVLSFLRPPAPFLGALVPFSWGNKSFVKKHLFPFDAPFGVLFFFFSS